MILASMSTLPNGFFSLTYRSLEIIGQPLEAITAHILNANAFMYAVSRQKWSFDLDLLPWLPKRCWPLRVTGAD